MRWRLRSIRQAADFPPEGEAALRAISGLGGVELAGVGGSGGASPGSERLMRRIFRRATRDRGRLFGRRPGRSPLRSRKARESGQEKGIGAQPSGCGWGSRRYGNPGPGQIGPGSGTARGRMLARCGPRRERRAGYPASDAAIMLRVAAGTKRPSITWWGDTIGR